MNRLRAAYAAAFGVAGLLAIAAAAVILTSSAEVDDVAPYAPAATPGAPAEVTVSPGQGTDAIGTALEDAGVIPSATQFEVLVALMGYDRLLQAGTYEFSAGTPPLEVIYRMRRGQVSTHSVTVVEGWRREQIADALAAEGIPRADFLAATASGAGYGFPFLAGLPSGASLEGYLYPATYNVFEKDTPQTMVQQMLQAFADNLPPGLAGQAAALGLSLHDAVTLASIIEREAKLPEEKPIMAQVFESRLALGMPLQADPTVQYAIADPAGPDYWPAELTQDDLDADSPYNTYLNQGLPPGPVCNPSAASILAVVQPAATDYLYFVARPDGSHAFAETLAEHQQNVEKYGNGGGQ
ncbi:MAG TPA: endolytic transglycosylase MltG [Dehalococcoidia bacterium]|jgi:UPF0755 protein|nr:endolytic transglycosylase MltG [Dehalococcoidia bacterium]